jgi:TRAP-type C4-dicarboxylate transport system permease large subunit
VGIAIFHLAVSYIAPTRFQRLGAMWDAVERAKDIAIGLAVLFIIFYGIMAAAATITGQFSTEMAWDLFIKIVSKPFVDLYKAVFPQQPGAPSPGP